MTRETPVEYRPMAETGGVIFWRTRGGMGPRRCWTCHFITRSSRKACRTVFRDANAKLHLGPAMDPHRHGLAPDRMRPHLHPAALLLISAALAFVVGFCIQRAGICAVRATEQWVYHRRTSRVRAFFSTAAWSGLVILPLAWLLPGSAMLAEAAPVTWTVLAGGALFGMGAALNGACALGTVAKLTCGRTDYLATLVGIFLGAIAAVRLGIRSDATIPSSSPSRVGLAGQPWLAFGVVALPICPTHETCLRSPRLRLTTVVSFAVLGVCGGMLHGTAGGWTYISLLAGLADRGRRFRLASPPYDRARLYLGAVRRRHRRSGAAGAFRPGDAKRVALRPKLAGGAMMGIAAMMIPGVTTSCFCRAPLAQRNAWAAYAAMMGSLWVVMLLHRAWARRGQRVHPTDTGAAA